MSIFRRADYTSDTTNFLTDLKARRPSLEAEQREGRAIWWDKKLDRSAEAEYQDARVAQQAYVYQTGQHQNSR